MGGTSKARGAPAAQPTRQEVVAAALARARAGKIEIEDRHVGLIPAEMTFREWCEGLAEDGLKVDGKPFTLHDRPAMAWIYDLVPSTQDEAFRHTLALMKCAQVGFTVMEMLAAIYFGLKFQPTTIGMFLPDQALAQLKSTERFMPIVRTVPNAHALMTHDPSSGQGRKKGEGNVRVRRLGESMFIFSWTSGRSTTESIPMDFLCFDEVQEMTLTQMEKTLERLSASHLRYTLMGSTANWPELDIHHWFLLGKQWRFHTECPSCGAKKPLDDYFPACIQWDKTYPGELTMQPGAYRYVCENGHWIDDTQRGEWIAANPDAWVDSVQFHQMLSPTITAGQIMQKCADATDRKNFYNRVLGKPYLDPTQIPVTLEHMKACVAAGKAIGLKWKQSGNGCFMGIDQMGNYNVVVIKERLRDGRQAVVHLEEIYSDDPFARCSELMSLFGVPACFVEINPNYNDAKRFANSHKGRVFLCDGFGSLPDDMVKWGDAPTLDSSDRRTDEKARDRFTVKADQFKCMQTSMARFTAKEPTCLFPDPAELVQEVVDKGVKQMASVADRAFLHFTKTALVVEKVTEGGEKEATTNKYRRVVRKVGLDPHFSYANQLCDVAWARAHGTSTFILPTPSPAAEGRPDLPGLPIAASSLLIESSQISESESRCGRCWAYRPDPPSGVTPQGRCTEQNIRVEARELACPIYAQADA